MTERVDWEKVREDCKHPDALILKIGYVSENPSLGSVPGQVRPPVTDFIEAHERTILLTLAVDLR